MACSAIATNVDTAIVLAGGLGTRLREAVPDLPKPLAPIDGRPFLEYLFDYWHAQGIRRFILSVGYRAEMIRAHFGNRYRDARIDYAEEESPLGTGGGLLLASAMLENRNSVLLLNGDTFFAVELKALQDFHQEHRSNWTFSTFRTAENGRYLGMDIDPDGRVHAFRSARNSGERLANGGVYLFAPALLDDIQWATGERLSLEEELFPALLATGCRFYGAPSPGTFIDIGVPEDYGRAAAILGVSKK